MRRVLLRGLQLLAAAGLAGLLLILFVNGVVMPRMVAVPQVTVPRVVGQTMAQARRQLGNLGLRLAYRDTLYSDRAPAGTIVGQDPPPASQIKRGRVIRVDVSLGPQYHVVPATLRGVSLREAQLQLEAHQLVRGEILYVSSDQVPESAVISSIPPPGTRLPRATPVDLEVSSGPADRPKPVPDLLGVPIAQVEDSLRKYEMRLGIIATRLEPDQPEGRVLEQTPVAGTPVARHTPVSLVLSAGPQPAEPPSEPFPEEP